MINRKFVLLFTTCFLSVINIQAMDDETEIRKKIPSFGFGYTADDPTDVVTFAADLDAELFPEPNVFCQSASSATDSQCALEEPAQHPIMEKHHRTRRPRTIKKLPKTVWRCTCKKTFVNTHDLHDHLRQCLILKKYLEQIKRPLFVCSCGFKCPAWANVAHATCSQIRTGKFMCLCRTVFLFNEYDRLLAHQKQCLLAK